MFFHFHSQFHEEESHIHILTPGAIKLPVWNIEKSFITITSSKRTVLELGMSMSIVPNMTLLDLLPISVEESRLLGAGNAYTPVRAGFAGDTYTPANETAQHGGARMERDGNAGQSKDNQSQWCLYL